MWHFEYQWTLIGPQREVEALIRPIFGGVVSHFSSASSVGDIWAMRDDDPAGSRLPMCRFCDLQRRRIYA